MVFFMCYKIYEANCEPKKAFKAMQFIKNMDSISQGFIPYKPIC